VRKEWSKIFVIEGRTNLIILNILASCAVSIFKNVKFGNPNVSDQTNADPKLDSMLSYV
jgi:hypothetical protein